MDRPMSDESYRFGLLKGRIVTRFHGNEGARFGVCFRVDW